jgi:hypothetical protein
MKLTTTQLRKLIAEEVKAARGKNNPTRITEALSPEEVDMAKNRILRSLGEARMELAELFEMTDDSNAMSAANDLDDLITLVTNITGTP